MFFAFEKRNACKMKKKKEIRERNVGKKRGKK